MFNIDKSISKIINNKTRSKLNAHLRPLAKGVLPAPSHFINNNKLPNNNKIFSNQKILNTTSLFSNRIINNFGLKQFGGKNDIDGDGIPNKKDCQPNNTMRQDKIYSVRPFREKFDKHIIPTDLDKDYHYDEKGELYRGTYPSMRGRGTGWFGSGVYGFRTREQAESYLNEYGSRAGHPGYIREFEIKKPFKPKTDFESEMLHTASKELYENNDNFTLNITAKRFKNLGIDTNIEELKKVKTYAKRSGEQPINYLLKKKGYTGVIPTDKYQNTSYGSVMYANKVEQIPLDKTPFTKEEIKRRNEYQKLKGENTLYNKDLEQKRFEKDILKVIEKPEPIKGEVLEHKYNTETNEYVIVKEKIYTPEERQKAAKEYYGDKYVKAMNIQKTFEQMENKNYNGKGYEDNDNDGVINAEDCEPKNPNKQGKIHNRMKPRELVDTSVPNWWRGYQNKNKSEIHTNTELEDPLARILAIKKNKRKKELEEEREQEETNRIIKEYYKMYPDKQYSTEHDEEGYKLNKKYRKDV